MISNSKKRSSLFAVALTILFAATFFSCKADEEIVQRPVLEEYLEVARGLLQDSIVLNATAMMGTVNKTLLPEGCPLKYYFSWTDEGLLNLQIRKFSVGKMPVTVWFGINCKFMQLNTWEKDEYLGAGWIKFEGTKGFTQYSGNANDENKEYQNGTGGSGTVVGYFNAVTHEIVFVMNFNVMNMSSDVYLQKIDRSRMDKFEEEFAKFERDLARYKEEHGL
jgi:hypothetical protein